MKEEDLQHIKQPEDDNATLWRYMNFEQFVSMLVYGGLRFTCLSVLEEKDPYEGFQFGKARNELEKFSKFITNDMDEALSGHDEERLKAFDKNFLAGKDQIATLVAEIESIVYVNCWHLSEVESAGMWSQYAHRDAGISIRCRYSKLRSLLGSKLGIGLVEYLEEAEFHKEVTGFSTSMRKRKAFDYEHEVRAFIPVKSETGFLPMGGYWQTVDLNGLIDGVIIAPTAPDWLQEVVEKVSKKYGLHAPVTKSDLLNKPFPLENDD